LIDGAQFEIDYSIPGASGYVVTEDVEIGGITAEGMSVGVATVISDYLVRQEEFDGILGLAFKYGNSSKLIHPLPKHIQPTYHCLLA
jgi:hypothetical protein